MQNISLTSEICDIIRSFRIQNEKSAKDISAIINKTPSYLSKIESGATKKIDSAVFIDLCNAIKGSTTGITSFIEFAYRNDTEYSKDTTLMLENIDDILYKFNPPKELLRYINKLMESKNISIEGLVAELNSNADLKDLSETVYNSLPLNVYTYIDDDKNNTVIKLLYERSYVAGILSGANTSNYITLEAILYSLYKLCGKTTDKARIKTIETLNDKFNVVSIRKQKTIIIKSKEDEEKYLGKLDPDAEHHFKEIVQYIRFALLLSQSKGGKERIETLCKNLETDLGFTFAFISTDLEKIYPISKELKKDFLKDLNNLIKEYSKKTDENIDYFFND